MEKSFITFIIFADSLEDPALAHTVSSIRSQNDLIWNLEVRISALPEGSTIRQFTHGNPRVAVVCGGIVHGGEKFFSEVFAILPRGVSLLPNTCFELHKAFLSEDVRVITLRHLSYPEADDDLSLRPTPVLPVVSVVRHREVASTSQWMHEISLPLVIIQGGLRRDSQVERVALSSGIGEPDLMENIRVKAEHITLLESELVISSAQLAALASRLNTLEVHARNIEIANDGLCEANDSLNSANDVLGEENRRFILEIKALNAAHNAKRKGLVTRIRSRFSA